MGLKSPGVCPECETPFYIGRRAGSDFTDVSLDVLVRQSRWMLVMAVSGAAMGIAWGLVLVLESLDKDSGPLCLLGFFAASTMWSLAVMMLTWPWSSKDDLQRPEPVRKARGLRVSAWILSLCAPLAGVVLVFAHQLLERRQAAAGLPVGPLSASMPRAFGFACLLMVVTTLGAAVLGVFFSMLADWYDDPDLCERFRGSMLFVLVVPVPLGWMLLVPPQGALTVPAWGVACLGLVVVLFFFLRPFVQLAALAAWACKSADLAHGHELRAARKRVERIEQGLARDPKPVPPAAGPKRAAERPPAAGPIRRDPR
jgi:hypothetical protein